MLAYHDNSGASRSVWLAARLTGAQAGRNFSRGIRVPDRIIKGMSIVRVLTGQQKFDGDSYFIRSVGRVM